MFSAMLFALLLLPFTVHELLNCISAFQRQAIVYVEMQTSFGSVTSETMHFLYMCLLSSTISSVFIMALLSTLLAKSVLRLSRCSLQHKHPSVLQPSSYYGLQTSHHLRSKSSGLPDLSP